MVYNCHQAAVNMRLQLTDAAHAEILERIAECNHMTVTHVDRNIFLVKLRGDQWTINLLEKTCTCKVFDLDHLPCAPALAAARERNLDYTSLCADYYKKEVLADAYSILIMPVGHPNTWVIPPDIKNRVVLTPDIRTQSGRPRRSRFQSVSESPSKQKCKKCGTQGHNSRRCPNPGPSSSSTIPDAYRRKCSVCHEIGHNKQTCPKRDEIVGDNNL
ncbi:hypothetical protein Dsin_007102 [Dipteronia sinensis]|uniref:CCHC-type domain-containing protein n=1 Tax=Dipteronia sinensis TaxID=43782 RepID=A0AAE0B0J5_9ROSI|nr:hypothetical protein Dsin_007102 [Dipteronia sinensis]